MGKKSYFATIKCIIYDFIDKVVSLHQLKQTDVVKRHFIIFYLYK